MLTACPTSSACSLMPRSRAKGTSSKARSSSLRDLHWQPKKINDSAVADAKQGRPSHSNPIGDLRDAHQSNLPSGLPLQRVGSRASIGSDVSSATGWIDSSASEASSDGARTAPDCGGPERPTDSRSFTRRRDRDETETPHQW